MFIDRESFREAMAFLPYQELYGVALALVFFFVWISTAFISIILKCFSKKSSTKSEDPQNPVPTSTDHDPFDDINLNVNQNQANNNSNSGVPDNIGLVNLERKHEFRCLDYASEFFSWASYLSFAAILVSLSAFGVIPLWASIILTFILLLLKLTQNFHQVYIFEGEEAFPNQKLETLMESWYSMISKHFKLFIFSLCFVTGVTLISHLITNKSCINDHTDGYGIPLLGGRFIYSSAFYRFLTIPKVCGNEAPCHIYATVPFNTSSSVFINVHTNVKVKEIVINYEKTSVYNETGTLTYNEISSYTVHQEYDHTGERNIHAVLLQNLDSNELYTIEIYYNGKTQAITSYQTLPGPESSEKYTLVYSGDAGYNLNSMKMTPIIAEQKPLALMIGGDIAYDDGANSCYYTMDLFLSMIEKGINQKLNRLVPIILGVGNHDVGMNSLWNVPVKVDEKGPSYYVNFPQSLPVNNQGEPQNRVPTVTERRTYRAHMIGNMLNVFLDSGYKAAYGGEQGKWLKNIAKDYKNNPKVAIYHDPIFSPCYNPGGKYNTTEAGVENWVPVFTEYKFMAVFEHHAHAYKKTFPMKGVEKAADGIGTVYFGDGAWGPDSECQIENPQLKEMSNGIYQSVSGVNHVWVVKVDPSEGIVSFEPVGNDHIPVDSATVQNMSHFIDL